MPIALFTSENDIKKNTVIDDNVDVRLLQPTIWMAQERHIQEIVGSNLYNKLQSDIVASTLTGDYLTLVDDYLVPALRWWVMFEADITLLYKYRNKNVATKNSENSNPVDFTQHKYLRDHNKDQAEWWSQRAIDWLCDNQELFPEYTDINFPDILPRNTKYSSTMFLGVGKTKSIKQILGDNCENC